MSVVRWDPWKELVQLRERTDRMWDVFLTKLSDSETEGSQTVHFMPDVDIVETAHDIRVFVSAPGMIEDDFEILVSANVLTIRGQRESPYDPSRSLLREWRYGFFERRLCLPTAIDVDGIRANYDAGVLTVVLIKRSVESREQPEAREVKDDA